MFHYMESQVDAGVNAALAAIGEDFPIRPHQGRGRSSGKPLVFRLEGSTCCLRHEDGRMIVSGGSVPQLLRALAFIRGCRLQRRQVPRQWEQRPRFRTLGLMLDTSRNAVPRVETLKAVIRRLALMGMNTLLLYMEDTYEVPSQPQIGYLRGRYTQAELREVDRYAAVLGVEVVPCIQTLAHLSQMLRWPEFEDVRDTSDILLVDEPKTYRLLDQMIGAAAAPFRSRRIHLGMDEAHGLGTGKYHQRHGTRPGFEIMASHLRQVNGLTASLGLRAMIWSDMYFRLGSRTGDYYDPNWRIPAKVAKSIPSELQLVYWDYYHTDPADYAGCIARHRTLGREPIFAGGLWTWNTFWQNFSKVRVNNDAAMLACKQAGLQEAFTTAWWDDGSEADLFSMFPGVQHFAEHGYREAVDDDDLRLGYHGSMGATLDSWTLPARLDLVPGLASMKDVSLHTRNPSSPGVAKAERSAAANLAMANPSKYLLWQDPMLGIFDAHIDGLPLAEHYLALCREIGNQRRRSNGLQRKHLGSPEALASALARKSDLGVRLFTSYRAGDRAGLRRLADQVIPALLRDVRRLHRRHEVLWMSLHKPQGWEVLEGRYAHLESRLATSRRRIHDYLARRVSDLAELGEPRRRISDWPAGKLGLVEWPARRMSLPSTVS